MAACKVNGNIDASAVRTREVRALIIHIDVREVDPYILKLL